jgi:hypothetical protein
MYRWVLETLKKKKTPKEVRKGLYGILDEETDQFVLSLWKAMIFENMKIDQSITREAFKTY